MDLSFILRGLILGFSIAAPVGPIGILCIRRTLASGRVSGLASGLGAATADAIYGTIAAFGLAFISNFLVNQQSWIRLIGGAFLCWLGLKIFLARPADQSVNTKNISLFGAYLSTFILTLTNPMTILSFAAMFAGLGLSAPGTDYQSALLLVIGFFLGSTIWWLTLSTGVSLIRTKFNQTAMHWVNRISGAVIIAFGVVAVTSAL